MMAAVFGVAVKALSGHREPSYYDIHNTYADPRDPYAFLRKAGVTPEQVDLVLCTHLHVDHVGWNTKLVDGAWVPTFPNARYLFVDREYEHWRSAPGLFGTEDVFGDSVAPIVEAGPWLVCSFLFIGGVHSISCFLETIGTLQPPDDDA